MMSETMLSQAMPMAPVEPTWSTFREQGMPPTSQFGWGFLPPKMV